MRNPYDIGRILDEMTLSLIASLKRNMARHKAEEIKEGFRWEMWQRAKLRNIQAYRKRNRGIVATVFKAVEKAISWILRRAFRRGERNVENSIKQIMSGDRMAAFEVSGEVILPEDGKPPKTRRKLTYPELPQLPDEQSFFGINEKKLEALEESVKKDFRNAQGGVMRKMDDVYRQTIYKAQVNMAAGAKTLDQAIDMATKDFLERGINVIEYENGRKVNIASWAEMALRTASQRATFLGEGKKRSEWGIYTVVMSAHANCSPWCLPYQGTVMVDDVYTTLTPEQAEQQAQETGYKRLSEAMKDGAFHPNCRHSLATYFPGITQLPSPVDDEQAAQLYKAEQHQRYIERNIRRYKRLVAGSLDERNQERYKRKVQEWSIRMEELLEAYPQLRRDRTREVDKTVAV